LLCGLKYHRKRNSLSSFGNYHDDIMGASIRRCTTPCTLMKTRPTSLLCLSCITFILRVDAMIYFSRLAYAIIYLWVSSLRYSSISDNHFCWCYWQSLKLTHSYSCR
jgi:hypothetical protein